VIIGLLSIKLIIRIWPRSASLERHTFDAVEFAPLDPVSDEHCFYQRIDGAFLETLAQQRTKVPGGCIDNVGLADHLHAVRGDIMLAVVAAIAVVEIDRALNRELERLRIPNCRFNQRPMLLFRMPRRAPSPRVVSE
jgi:hypothetical protein